MRYGDMQKRSYESWQHPSGDAQKLPDGHEWFINIGKGGKIGGPGKLKACGRPKTVVVTSAKGGCSLEYSYAMSKCAKNYSTTTTKGSTKTVVVTSPKKGCY